MAMLIRKVIQTFFSLCFLLLVSFYLLINDSLHQNAYYYMSDFGRYLINIITLNWGNSSISQAVIFDQIFAYLTNTLILCIPAFLLSLCVGTLLNLVNFITRKSLVGKILDKLSILGLALPVFWIAIVVLYLNIYLGSYFVFENTFDYTRRLIDINFWSQFDFYSLTNIKSLLFNLYKELNIAVVILTIPLSLEIMKLFNEKMESLLKKDFVKTAQSRGYSRISVWYNYLFNNTFFSLIPEILRQFLLLFSFSIITENVLNYPGLGSYLTSAISVSDTAVISSTILVIGSFVLLIDLLGAVLVFLVDPKNKKGWFNE